MPEATTTAPASPAAPTAPTAPPAAPPSPPVSDWRVGLTGDYEALRAENALAQIKGKDWSEAGPLLAKGYVNAQKVVGVQIPGKDAKPEQIAAFRERLGVPKDVTGYGEVKVPELEGLGQIDLGIVDNFAKPEFLRSGLTPGQAQDMVNLYGQLVANQRRALADSFVKGQEQLEGEWGLNFDAHVALAQRAIRRYASDGFLKLLADSQLDMHPDMIRMFHRIGTQIAEDGLIEGAVGVKSGEDVEREIKDIRGKMPTLVGRARTEAEARLEVLYRTRFGTGEPERR